MSLLKKASIITTPTAYGVGVLNSIKPAIPFGDELIVNGNFTTDSDWTKGTGWTISGGKANSDGSQSTISDLEQNITLNQGSTYLVEFDLIRSSGTLYPKVGDTTGTGLTSTQSVSQTIVAGSSNKLELRADANFIGSIDNVSVKEVTDADFDFSRTSSATRVNSDNLIETSATNTPRLDYTNGTASILLEPQSTNLLTYSELFDNSYWTKSALSAVSGFISPDGNANAFKLVEDTSSGVHRLLNSAIALSGDILISIFAKKGERNWFKLSNNNVIGAYFDLQSGSVGTVDSGVTANIENYGNGWYRCSILKNRATSGSERLVLDLSLDGSGTSYLGDGTSGIYIYGAQLEALSYPTSYIPTSGSTVTRAAETLNNAGNSDLINSTEGVLYAEVATLVEGGSNRFLGLSDGSSNNRVVILYTNAANKIRAILSSGGIKYVDKTVDASSTTDFNKVAIKYKANDFALWINGVEVATDTTLNAPVGLDRFDFLLAGSNNFYGKVKSVAVFKEALSDTELACLTSTNNREIFLNYYYRMQYVEANTEALSCAEQTFNI